MRLRSRVVVALVALIMSLALPVRADDVAGLDASAADLLARLARAQADLTTLKADFVQTSRIKLFRQALSSRGRLWFARPRRIRWEYLAPDPSVLVLDGERATLQVLGGPKEVFDLTRDAPMRAVFDQLLLWLGGGALGSASADYRLGASSTPKESRVWLEPREGKPAARVFTRIELTFDRALVLSRILLRETGGDEKEIVFAHVMRNRKLPADTFR